MFSTFEIMLFAVIGFICVYAIIDRICKCIEQKYIAKAFEKSIEEGKATIVDKKYIDDNIL